jgi:acyl-CoA synthetase (AMP-forming)/AMP-acid ligase II
MATIVELLHNGAAKAPAIAAPGRAVLSYEGLRAQVARTVAELNGLGAGRGDPVAIVLPNGPEMAAAFVAIAAGATTAPLNPAYTADEFDFYLQDLQARLLVVQAGADTPAVAAAERAGIPVARLEFDAAGPAGAFTLRGDPGAARQGGPAAESDVALVLHTSGTTARPKIVPLTHGNVCASAASIAASLALTPQDHCLNVMPLFHIHGLIALKFFAWLDEVQPTWYTAVPTMHQAILDRAPRNRESIGRARLRLIRSSSASLPPQVMAALEATFDAPVIEAYGMTEAAHQMACNPLPPGVRKPGSVGVAAGPEIAVMGADSQLVAAGEVGEIVIRGPNVTPGYQGNPQANAKAFTNGWFRTGDQGVLDEDGYLRITGRLKEIINRGGEKISPREVDDVLMDHPAISQVVTFAVPHPKLARERLADMKVPRTVIMLDEIPKGATGKLQRIGLAEKLGLG